MTADGSQALAGVTCVLLDLDGTLIDSIGLITASFRHSTATVLGVSLPDDELLQDLGMPLRPQMERISPEHAEELLAAYRGHNHENHDRLVREYPGTREALEAMALAGTRLGVVTSKLAGIARRGVERFGYEDFIEVLVTADDTSRHKPEPDPLWEAARRLGVEPAECAYVGDSPHDVTAARRAAMVAVAALWGPFPRERVIAAGPALALGTPGELPGLLEAARSPEARAKALEEAAKDGPVRPPLR